MDDEKKRCASFGITPIYKIMCGMKIDNSIIKKYHQNGVKDGWGWKDEAVPFGSNESHRSRKVIATIIALLLHLISFFSGFHFSRYLCVCVWFSTFFSCLWHHFSTAGLKAILQIVCKIAMNSVHSAQLAKCGWYDEVSRKSWKHWNGN